MEKKPLHLRAADGLEDAIVAMIDTALRIGVLLVIAWLLPDSDGSILQKTIEEMTLKDIFVAAFGGVAILQFLFPPRVEITRG